MPQPPPFWAHSSPDGLPPEDGGWQLLSNHLENVGALARVLAARARPEDLEFQDAAELAGLLHDFGKYTDCFQKMIRTGQGRCQHSGHGAAIAYRNGFAESALAIAGHHAGIPDATGGTGTLAVRVKDCRDEAESLRERAQTDFIALSPILQATHPRQ